MVIIKRIKHYLNMVQAQADSRKDVHIDVRGMEKPIIDHACKILLFGEQSTSWRGRNLRLLVPTLKVAL